MRVGGIDFRDAGEPVKCVAAPVVTIQVEGDDVWMAPRIEKNTISCDARKFMLNTILIGVDEIGANSGGVSNITSTNFC